MPVFLHVPSNRTVEATGQRSRRFRRSSRFVEVDSAESDADSASTTIQSFASPDSGSFSESAAPDTTESTTGILVGVDQMTVNQVLVWVDGDPAAARLALDAELAGRNRKTLVAALRRLL